MNYYVATYDKVTLERYKLKGLKLDHYILFRIDKEANDILINIIASDTYEHIDKRTFKTCFKIIRTNGTPKKIKVTGDAIF
jgi:hypothetical protein